MFFDTYQKAADDSARLAAFMLEHEKDKRSVWRGFAGQATYLHPIYESAAYCDYDNGIRLFVMQYPEYARAEIWLTQGEQTDPLLVTNDRLKAMQGSAMFAHAESKDGVVAAMDRLILDGRRAFPQ